MAYEALGPDYTSPEELRRQSLRELEEYQARQRAAAQQKADRRRLILSAVLGSLGGTPGPAYATAANIQERRRREELEQFRAQQLQEQRDYDEGRYMDTRAASLEEPELARDPRLAAVLERRRRLAESDKAEGLQRHEREFAQIHPPAAPERPVSVAPGSTLYDPATRSAIYTAPERDTTEADTSKSVSAMRKRDLALKVQQSQVKRDIARVTADPDRHGELDALYEELKALEEERASIRQQPGGFAATMGPRYVPPKAPQPPAGTPAPATVASGSTGYTKEQIAALRQAMDEDDREEFDSYSPEDQKKVLDEAYGRSVRR